MKIASVDIGTNAVKSKIFKTTPTSIKYIDGIRSPIRLGAEVFKKGKLSEKKLKELIHTLKKYQIKFIKDKVDQYEIVATSALRNTSNSEEARRYIENKIEHPIRIISGLEEAQLISFHPKAQQEKNKMFVDVGGGSTEIYIYKNSNHSFQSFQLCAQSPVERSMDQDCLALSYLHNKLQCIFAINLLCLLYFSKLPV